MHEEGEDDVVTEQEMEEVEQTDERSEAEDDAAVDADEPVPAHEKWFHADSNITSTTNRNGSATTYSYDGLDRRISLTDPLGNATVTSYDPDSNVIGLTDANGHTTSYRYDGLNRQIMETYPDALPNTRTNFYDAVGNVIERIDQNGQTTTYSYNGLYYLTNRAYLPSGANDSFTYDDGGRVLNGNRNGWMVTFAYDGADRVTNTVQNGRVLTYSYNLPGRVETNMQPSGRTLSYTYDARNRLVSLQDGTPNPPVVTYTYDDADRVVTRNYRNGTTAEYIYNANNWVTTIEHSNATSLIAGFNYAYDNEGNKLYEQKLHNPGDSETFLYDSLDRMTNEDVGVLSGSVIPSPTIVEAWNLDPVGNWNTVTSNGVPEVRTHGPSDEILTDRAQPYFYDANGNLTQDTAYKYAYDEENRLVQVQRQSDSAIVGQYYYDIFGRRIAEVVDPAGTVSTNYYFYDGARVIEEQGPGGATTSKYTYGNYVDEVLTMDRAGQTYYYHQNALLSPHALSDSAGAVAERYVYDAYGYVTVLDAANTPLPLNSWGTPHSAVINRFLFTGRELDEEDGLSYYRSRSYDPAKGRFLQRDSVTDTQSEFNNLYEYVRSNPVNWVDPYGQQALSGLVLGLMPNAIGVPMQALEIQKPPEPRLGYCGAIWWTIQWQLNQRSKAGGLVMQDVTFTWKIQNCAGQDVSANFVPFPNPLQYWEVWSVAKNARAPSPNGDTFAQPSRGLCTKGETSIEGKANFFEGVRKLPQNGGWSSPNARTLAGTLYSTTTDPTTKDPFKNPSTATIDHVLKFKWNCCPNTARKTDIVSRVP